MCACVRERYTHTEVDSANERETMTKRKYNCDREKRFRGKKKLPK